MPHLKSKLFELCDRELPRPAHRIFVPGRIELLGKHTDYAGGRSIVGAIDRGIGMTASPRDDRVVNVIAGTQITRFRLDPNLSPRIGEWSNYPMTVARRIARNFPGDLRGADIAFASDLPQAAGLSSSSALMIATFMALDAVNHLHQRPEYTSNIRTREDLAGYLSTIENGQTFGTLNGDSGVGTSGGSQDHTAIVCARDGALSQYSFCPVRHERDVPMPPGQVFVIAVSGAVAEKTKEARELYNRVSRSVGEILDIWRRETGRSDASLADAVRSDPSAIVRLRDLVRNQPRLLNRFEQFVEESETLVPAAGDALIRNDLAALGETVARSQSLAERLLGNQIEETIALARLGRECDASAASAFGAGFGGSVWAMVGEPASAEFLNRWQSRYLAAFPQRADRAQFLIARPASAASIG